MYRFLTGDKLKIAEKIKQRRYQMIVHSCIYYVMDENIISDHTWAAWALELADLQNKHPDIASLVEFDEYFQGWDGSSGYNLPIYDDWVIEKAQRLLWIRGIKNV